MTSRPETTPPSQPSTVRRHAPLACAGAFLLAALPALAAQVAPPAQAPAGASQEPAATEPAASPEDQTPRIEEEIVVTARKREENLQEVPVAISVMTAERLEDTAASDISEIQTSVPNLSIYAGRNQSTTLTAFMRGIGQADPLPSNISFGGPDRRTAYITLGGTGRLISCRMRIPGKKPAFG